MLRIGRTRNTYDEAKNFDKQTISDAAWVKIMEANSRRIGYIITNLSNKTLLVVEGNEPSDLIDRGYAIWARSTAYSEPDNITIGEIWVKMQSGSGDILVTDKSNFVE